MVSTRVLVVVSGGVATIYTEGEVITGLYDTDDAADDPNYPPVGADFAHLARQAGIPHEETP